LHNVNALVTKGPLLILADVGDVDPLPRLSSALMALLREARVNCDGGVSDVDARALLELGGDVRVEPGEGLWSLEEHLCGTMAHDGIEAINSLWIASHGRDPGVLLAESVSVALLLTLGGQWGLLPLGGDRLAGLGLAVRSLSILCERLLFHEENSL
jgi:hypothetical protein